MSENNKLDWVVPGGEDSYKDIKVNDLQPGEKIDPNADSGTARIVEEVVEDMPAPDDNPSE